MSEISGLIADTRVSSCLDCGRCTAACPVSRYDPSFSPRKLVQSLVLQRKDALDTQLWSCITCSMCQERCYAGVEYVSLVKSLRSRAFGAGSSGQCAAHGGAWQSLSHLMGREDLKQDRLGWTGKKLRTASKGEVLYFTGCQPYFDVIFSDIGVGARDIARGAVKLLNHLDIVPAVLANERCCGHDLLWAGDTEGFARLAERNLKEIKRAGAKKIVVTCPECYQTLKFEYPRLAGGPGFEVVHLSEMLAENKEKFKFKRLNARVTYHDPCRLGRFAGIYDAPRAIINAVPALELLEMPRNRSNALCCGTQAWLNCGAANKQIQAELLREASSTGAGVLLTSCPKCQIHLKCAMNDGRLDKEVNIKIADLTDFIARALNS